MASNLRWKARTSPSSYKEATKTVEHFPIVFRILPKYCPETDSQSFCSYNYSVINFIQEGSLWLFINGRQSMNSVFRK
jgi:hypothetical protein